MAEQHEQQPDHAPDTDRDAAGPAPAESGADGPAADGSGEPSGTGVPSPAGGEPGAEPPEAAATAPGEQEPQAPEATAPGGPGPDEPGFDEQAAWEAIVAGYGEEPPDPPPGFPRGTPGARPFKPIEDLALLEPDPGVLNDGWDGTGGRRRPRTDGTDSTDSTDDDSGSGTPDGRDRKDSPDGKKDAGSGAGPGRPLGSSVLFAPGMGPRDYSPKPPSDDDPDDEGHFIPPDPGLPDADTTAKFGWLAVLGGPVLLLLAVLLGWQLTWWLTTLGVGGFIGGFATLVIRMNPGDEDDDDDPGRGAVV